MIDFTLVIDSALTHDQCDQLISQAESAGLSSKHLATHLHYRHYDFPSTHAMLTDLNSRCLSAYTAQFPQLRYIDNGLEFSPWRFKHFPPTYAFDRWHSEHNLAVAHRVLCIIVYLSDNECGTEFMHDSTVIESRKGRAVVFPTFWTHTHRGQLDPLGVDRYIMSTYAHFTPTNSEWVKRNPVKTIL